MYLGFLNSIVTTFNVHLCAELIVLITKGSKIRELNIVPLRKLEALEASQSSLETLKVHN